MRGQAKIIKLWFLVLMMYLVGAIVYSISWFLFRIIKNLNWSPMVERLVISVFLVLKYMVMN